MIIFYTGHRSVKKCVTTSQSRKTNSLLTSTQFQCSIPVAVQERMVLGSSCPGSVSVFDSLSIFLSVSLSEISWQPEPMVKPIKHDNSYVRKDCPELKLVLYTLPSFQRLQRPLFSGYKNNPKNQLLPNHK